MVLNLPEAAVLASAPCVVVVPSNALSACHVTVKGTVAELSLYPDGTTLEPPEVAASAAESLEVSVVPTYELSSCPVPAKEAICESSSCPANNEPSFAHVTAYELLSCPESAEVVGYELSSCPDPAFELLSPVSHNQGGYW